MSTLLFHALPDSFAILKKNGVYKQAGLFHKGDRLYAAAAGGFVRLGKFGTSVPNLEVEGELEVDPKLISQDALGWYVYEPGRVTSKLRAV